MQSEDGTNMLIAFLRGDKSMLRCTVCGNAPPCGCWTKCPKPGCSWSFRAGEKCRNPAHPETTHAAG
jgi:hypothetical protein